MRGKFDENLFSSAKYYKILVVWDQSSRSDKKAILNIHLSFRNEMTQMQASRWAGRMQSSFIKG